MPRPETGLQEHDMGLRKRFQAIDEYERQQEMKRREPPAPGCGIDGRPLMGTQIRPQAMRPKPQPPPEKPHYMSREAMEARMARRQELIKQLDQLYTLREVAEALHVSKNTINYLARKVAAVPALKFHTRYYTKATVQAMIDCYRLGIVDRRQSRDKVEEIRRMMGTEGEDERGADAGDGVREGYRYTEQERREWSEDERDAGGAESQGEGAEELGEERRAQEE